MRPRKKHRRRWRSLIRSWLGLRRREVPRFDPDIIRKLNSDNPDEALAALDIAVEKYRRHWLTPGELADNPVFQDPATGSPGYQPQWGATIYPDSEVVTSYVGSAQEEADADLAKKITAKGGTTCSYCGGWGNFGSEAFPCRQCGGRGSI